jgi:predicted peroxiredoxin
MTSQRRSFIMRSTAFLVFLLLSSVALASGCAHTGTAGAPTSVSVDGKASLLINVTHGKSNLHSASMGLGLAKAALEHGHRVVVFLNVEGAALADRNLGADVRFADFPPIAELLKDIVAKGGKVFVCSHCAGVMKVSQENLAPGLVMSEHGSIVEELQPGMVGFTY